MKRIAIAVFSFSLLCLGLAKASSQSPSNAGQSAASQDVISSSTRAIGYIVGGGSTKVDLKGTKLMPQASGTAKVEAKTGIANIEVELKKLAQPMTIGTEFMTYVLWAVSPEGRSVNLGEAMIDSKGNSKLKVSTQMSVFSLIVTVEPYFAVRQPSEMVALENEIRKNTKGKIYVVNDYKLMKKEQYQKKANPLALTLDLKNVPLEMYQARNAFEIAKMNGADTYAPEIYKKAEASLQIAENTLKRKAPKKEIVSGARTAVQFFEDARALAMQRREDERIERERLAAAAKAKAEAEAKAASEAAAARQKAEAEAAAAKRKADAEASMQAELAASRESKLKAEADAEASRARAEAAVLKAKEDAAKAEAERAYKAAEALRAKLLQQFSQILETRDTERGLVVNMSDVLFDTGKFTLRGEAREKLARIAGIILNYPELRIETEGHTDNTGSADFNQKLSEQRADSVMQYLITQGIPAASITSVGRGFSVPVAENDTAAGRQKNRRVELIISGSVIGTAVGAVQR